MNSILYYNGTILTQQPKSPLATAMLIEDNFIVGVGESEEISKLRRVETRLVNLEGKCVMPGFNDAHIHVWKVGQLESYIIDLRGVESISDLQSKVKSVADTLHPGTWIMGRGFNEQVLADKRMPMKEDLDAISTQHPIYLIRTCAHIAAANSLALQEAGINKSTEAPEGGVIGKTEKGDLTGLFYETALGLITNHIPQPTREQYKKMITLGAEKLQSAGVTSATDPAVHPDLFEAYIDLYQSGEKKIRFNLMPILLPDGGNKPYPVPEKMESEFLCVRTVKFFSDGGLSGKTAALKRSYKNSTDKGVLRLSREQFLILATEAQQKGFQIATHAIGDEALDLVIEVYKELHKAFGNTRNRIEHFGLPSEKNIEEVAKFGFVVVPQTIFLDELGENFINALDDEYLKMCYPVKSLLEKKIHVALSTDAPVVKNLNPWSGIKAAITRRTNMGNVISEQESITMEQALYAYTMGGAFAEGKENIKGSLEPGKLADFILLNKNPLTVPTEEVDTIKVEATYVNGECVFRN